MATRRLIVAISGASGVIYGIRALQHLQAVPDVEAHLIISDGARRNIRIETDLDDEAILDLADVVHRADNLAAAVASGSFRTDGMMVVPCSIKSLSGIANSYADNLLIRAADVCLKEKRKLALVVRETPLHKGHLQLMTRAADLGAMILPPSPAFYQNPRTIDDLLDQTIGKLFDYFRIEHQLFRRWGESSATEE